MDIMKMKTARHRAISAGLALLIGLSGSALMAAPAMAAGPPTISPTTAKITMNQVAKTGKYKAYQLIAGTVDGNKIADATMTAGNADIVKATIKEYLTGKDLTDHLAGGTDFSSDATTVANEVMDCIGAIDKAGKAQAFANSLAKAFMAGGTAAGSATAANGTVEFDGLETGYYLVMSDTADAGLSTGEAMTSAVLMTLGADGTTATGKVKVPTVKKEVKDADGQWDKDFSGVADAGLAGDKGAEKVTTATYRLTGTMPANLDEYTTYKYSFVDKLPAGVDTTADELANWGVKVMAGDKDVSASFKASVATDDATHTSTVTWSCDDVKAIQGITKDSKITIEYTPVYDANDVSRIYGQASTLTAPQENTAHVDFSNNPYDQGAGTTSSTPDEGSKLYSYNLKVDKVDQNAAALTGATFTLTDADGKTLGRDITAADDGTFTFTGLESDVEYTLTETKTPAGMKKISPVKFTIAATKAADGGSVASIAATENSDPSNAATLTAADATVTATVVNLPGTDMPGTGAGGIWAGLVGGGLLLVVSGVAIARRKKKDVEETPAAEPQA